MCLLIILLSFALRITQLELIVRDVSMGTIVPLVYPRHHSTPVDNVDVERQ